MSPLRTTQSLTKGSKWKDLRTKIWTYRHFWTGLKDQTTHHRLACKLETLLGKRTRQLNNRSTKTRQVPKSMKKWWIKPLSLKKACLVSTTVAISLVNKPVRQKVSLPRNISITSLTCSPKTLIKKLRSTLKLSKILKITRSMLSSMNSLKRKKLKRLSNFLGTKISMSNPTSENGRATIGNHRLATTDLLKIPLMTRITG